MRIRLKPIVARPSQPRIRLITCSPWPGSYCSRRAISATPTRITASAARPRRARAGPGQASRIRAAGVRAVADLGGANTEVHSTKNQTMKIRVERKAAR
jgi:hypothetical protein